MDDIASSAINSVEKNLGKKPADQQPESTTRKVVRFFITPLWVIITLIVTLVAFYAMVAEGASGILEYLGFESVDGFGIFAVVICLLIAAITFLVPFLRRKGTTTRWCGIVALGDGLWWAYILMTM